MSAPWQITVVNRVSAKLCSVGRLAVCWQVDARRRIEVTHLRSQRIMLLRCRRSIAFRRWKLSILLAGCVLLIVWWMTTTTTRLDDEHGGPTPAVNHTTGTFYNAPDVSFRYAVARLYKNVINLYAGLHHLRHGATCPVFMVTRRESYACAAILMEFL